MKTHLAKVSLALLSAALVLGCQDQGSGTVGPDGLGPQFAKKSCDDNPNQGSCKGEEGGGVLVNLTMTSGLLIAERSPQTVTLKDGEKTLGFHAGSAQPINFAIDMDETRKSAAMSPSTGLDFNTNVCRPGGKGDPSDAELNELFAKLTDNSQTLDRTLFVEVDKETVDDPDTPTVEETSEEHSIGVRWEAADGSLFSMSVGKLSPCRSNNCGPGEQNVVAVTGDITTTGLTVTFKKGEIRLRNRTGKVPDNYSITCPNKDVITMVLKAAT